MRRAARARDAADPLAHLRARFVVGEDDIYCVGNSLGLPRVEAAERAAAFVREQWGTHRVAGWNRAGWMEAPFRVGDTIGRLIGAAPGQVVVGDTTTLQLHRALHAALDLRPEPTPTKRVIVVDAENFPADLYIAEGVAEARGCTLRRVPMAELGQAMNEEVAVLAASHVNFRDARALDMAELTQRAHAVGALAIWDLAHSTGVFDLQLDALEVDFAVGCTYKYLNGGPGAPAFLYANRRHHGRVRSRTPGWLGHRAPFDMAPDYEAAPGIRAFLCGTPRMASLDAMAFALELIEGVSMAAARRKSMELGEAFIAGVERFAADHELALLSPRRAEERGAHVALTHPRAQPLARALASRGVAVDFRAPDTLRFAFAPMYTRHLDAVESAARLGELLAEGADHDPAFAGSGDGPVT